MIEINLLPEELKVRIKARKLPLESIQNVEKKNFLYIIPAVFILLLCLHVYFLFVNFAKGSELRALSNKWQALAPQRLELENFNKEYALFSEDARLMQQMAERRVNWAQKLNQLSLGLPSGVWFSEISMAQGKFTLHGSAISLENEGMSLIKKFMDNLKADAVFFKDFQQLELGSAQSEKIGSYDVIDFVLNGALKAK